MQFLLTVSKKVDPSHKVQVVPSVHSKPSYKNKHLVINFYMFIINSLKIFYFSTKDDKF